MTCSHHHSHCSGELGGWPAVSRWSPQSEHRSAWSSAGALPYNPVYTSRRAHLTGRGHNKLNDGKARSALAAVLLRELLAVITQRVPWDPVIASGAALSEQVTATAA